MLTKLARKYGNAYNVNTYIVLAQKELRISDETAEKAREINSKVKSHYGATPSMVACALLYYAAIITGEYIESKRWTKVCAFNALRTNYKRLQFRLTYNQK